MLLSSHGDIWAQAAAAGLSEYMVWPHLESVLTSIAHVTTEAHANHAAQYTAAPNPTTNEEVMERQERWRSEAFACLFINILI